MCHLTTLVMQKLSSPSINNKLKGFKVAKEVLMADRLDGDRLDAGNQGILFNISTLFFNISMLVTAILELLWQLKTKTHHNGVGYFFHVLFNISNSQEMSLCTAKANFNL